MLGISELRSEVSELKEENRLLRDRVDRLYDLTRPFRISQPQSYLYTPMEWTDRRPSVDLHSAVELIMSHLKITFKAIKAVPERIEVEKIK